MDFASRAALHPTHAAMRALRIARLLWKRIVHDDLPAMASALAYKTLLGLIPILVVVTLVAKTLMGSRSSRPGTGRRRGPSRSAHGSRPW
jgi:uncharacterized BrkB/YihY/UPF0761 family membrane protein